MNKDFLKDLNKEQVEAVLQKDGSMIILAGAGSGKTRVLTYKVIYLIKEGTDPDNILMVTFTNKIILIVRLIKNAAYQNATEFPVDSLALPRHVANATSNNPAIINKIQFMNYFNFSLF